MSRRGKRRDAPGAVELVEEAVHLLRAAPPMAWVVYLAGVVPWVLGLGYFWATASWFSPRPEEILWRALGVAGLYVWLKTAQAEFCGHLRAGRFGEEPPVWTLRGARRTAWRQARVQGWAVLAMPMALVLTLPAAWVWMFFENATALATTRDADGDTLESRARREAMRWPGPAHVALLLFSGVWLCVWLNMATLFYAAPWLARTLLGVENLFGVSGWSVLNSTLLALVTILSWMAVDPLVKAYHVLRTFYGEARRTGEDLRLELGRGTRRAGRGTASRVVLTIALAALVAGAPGGGTLRAETTAPATTVTELDRALDDALDGRDFRWSLLPLPAPETTGADGDGWLKNFVRQGFELVAQVFRDIRDLAKDFGEWLDGLFKDKKDKPKPEVKKGADTDFAAVTRALLYVMLGLCLLALVWILWTSWKKRPPAPRVLAPLATMPVTPDLNDEKLEASRLPSNEWLELARMQLARGEWRLALRALYLGTLAGLGARGLVSLARAKTNLDYERELTRRAAGRADVVAGFRARRLSFECVWYGRKEAEETQVRAWLAELEREEGGTR